QLFESTSLQGTYSLEIIERGLYWIIFKFGVSKASVLVLIPAYIMQIWDTGYILSMFRKIDHLTIYDRQCYDIALSTTMLTKTLVYAYVSGVFALNVSAIWKLNDRLLIGREIRLIGGSSFGSLSLICGV